MTIKTRKTSHDRQLRNESLIGGALRGAWPPGLTGDRSCLVGVLVAMFVPSEVPVCAPGLRKTAEAVKRGVAPQPYTAARPPATASLHPARGGPRDGGCVPAAQYQAPLRRRSG